MNNAPSNNAPSMNDDRWNRFEELRDAALDGRITPDDMEALEAFVLGDPEMRRNYAEHVHQQAALRMSVAPPMPAMLHSLLGSDPDSPGEVTTSESAASDSQWQRAFWYAVSVAAAALLALGLNYLLNQRDADSTVAMITSSENCKWGECTLATTEGMPLGAGVLRLESGIATVRFPKVSVTLEGKSELEIVDSQKCLVHSGRVFANVEQGGEGFVIQTPTATFIDRGTTFGVNVGPQGTSDLTVFKGRVDVNHLSTAKEAIVRVDERLRASAESLQEFGKTDFPVADPGESQLAGRPVHISTASGIGDDAYLAAGEVVPSNTSTTALLVKKPSDSKPGQWYAPWRRKAFLRIDLSGVKESDILDATLQIHGVATNIGYASMMPDATFSVYGLIDESQDDWDSEKITWLDCPASAGDAIAVDPKAAMLVGSFVVPQSNPEGRFEVTGRNLLNFLRSDTNGRVTFILIPETVAAGGNSYVHGFASKRHPYLAAPTLRMRVK